MVTFSTFRTKEKTEKPNVINDTETDLVNKMREICGPDLQINENDLEHLRKAVLGGMKDSTEWYVNTGDKFIVEKDGSMFMAASASAEAKKKFEEIYG